MSNYIRVSANVEDSAGDIESVHTFALKTDPGSSETDLLLLDTFVSDQIADLTPMFDPTTKGDKSKGFDNAEGISFKVIGYLTNCFSNINNGFSIDNVTESNNVYIYTTNSLGYKKITKLENP